MHPATRSIHGTPHALLTVVNGSLQPRVDGLQRSHTRGVEKAHRTTPLLGYAHRRSANCRCGLRPSDLCIQPPAASMGHPMRCSLW